MFSNLSKRLFNPIKGNFFFGQTFPIYTAAIKFAFSISSIKKIANGSDVRDSKISLFIVVALHQIKMSNKRADALFSLIRLINFFLPPSLPLSL